VASIDNPKERNDRALPSGTVTFLFTDIEGSTKLWENFPKEMLSALKIHDEIVRAAIENNGGRVFKCVGDAFCAAFESAPDALKSALEANLSLQSIDWGNFEPIRIRSGLHTGLAEQRDGDYFGSTLNRVARTQAVGHGRQILLSEASHELTRRHLPEGTTLVDIGLYELSGLAGAERI
jgi:class 3 adenylate cyclase